MQDELYAMLGILNPERTLHRSRSEIFNVSPVSAARYLSSASRPSAAATVAESPRMRSRRDSLPGALSLTEAYNVMAVDVSFILLFLFYTTILTFFFYKRNAVLATIDMLNI